MRQIGKHELGLELARRAGQRRHVGVELAVAGTACQFAVLGQLLVGVDLLDGGRVPLQLERVAAQLGGPVAVGHHRHALGAAVQRNAHDGLHALDGARGAVVDRRQAGAEHRRMGHHRRELARVLDVDAEVLPAAALGGRVEALGRAADDAEVLRVLEHHLLGHRQRHRRLGQFAVARLAPARAEHRAGLRAQGGGVDLPARRRGRQQHGAGARAELAVLHEAVLDRVRAAGQVHAEEGVGIGGVVGAAAAAHQGPVGVELLGQDHRQAGLHALAELEPVDGHHDLAVGRDLHEGQRLLRRLEAAGGRGRAAGLRQGQMREGAERETARADDLEEAATRQRGGLVGRGAGHQALQRTRQVVVVDVGQHGFSFRRGCGLHRPRPRGCAHRCHIDRCCRPWPSRSRRRWAACPRAATAGRRSRS